MSNINNNSKNLIKLFYETTYDLILMFFIFLIVSFYLIFRKQLHLKNSHVLNFIVILYQLNRNYIYSYHINKKTC
jgi:hypothetical protein